MSTSGSYRRFVPTGEEQAQEKKTAPWVRRALQYEGLLQDAVEYLRREFPKIGYIIDSFQVRFVLTERVDTAAVTGDGTIYFNPYFIETAGWDYACGALAPLSIPELAFVVFHEIGHIIYDAHGRSKGKVFEDWNIAQDEVINWIAHKMGLPVINNHGFQVYRSAWAEHVWDEEAYVKIHSEREKKRKEQEAQSGYSAQNSNSTSSSSSSSSSQGQSSKSGQDSNQEAGEPSDASGQKQHGEHESPSETGEDNVPDGMTREAGEEDKEESQGSKSEEAVSDKVGKKLGSPEDYSSEETEERMTQWKKGEKGGIGTEKPDYDFAASEEINRNIDKEIVQRTLQRASNIEDQPGRGTMAGGFDRWMETIMEDEVQVPWQEELERRLQRMMIEYDDNWSRPRVNKIGVSRNLERRGLGRTFFPDEELEFQPIYLAVDTSGSIGDVTLRVIVGHVKRILQQDGINKVRFFAFDTEVHVDKEVIDVGDIEMKGGGGSSTIKLFSRAFVDGKTPLSINVSTPSDGEKRLVRKSFEEPGLMIIFSDFDVDFPEHPPVYKDKVLWVYTGVGEPRHIPPFGEWIRMYPKPKLSPFKAPKRKLSSVRS